MNTIHLPTWIARFLHRGETISSTDQLYRGETRKAVLDRARIALRAGDAKLAEALIEECDDRDCDPVCLNLLGLIAETRNDWSTARKCWGRALKYDCGNAPAYNNLLRWVELSRFGQTRVLADFGDKPNNYSACKHKALS